MKWLLRLYPQAWRQRYGEEVAALLVSEPQTLRVALDLVAGAIDSWINPQWISHNSEQRGQTVKKNKWISVLLVIGIAVAIGTASGVALGLWGGSLSAPFRAIINFLIVLVIAGVSQWVWRRRSGA